MKKLIIAIDGPSGAGKSTAGKGLAHKLGYLYIDTGAMYRVVGLCALRAGVPLDGKEQLAALVRRIHIELKGEPDKLQVLVDGRDVTEDIRTPEVSQAASIISSFNEVRQVLVERQQEMGKDGGVVMDGRDIGTHVFPQADVKFFVMADINERARRRNLEELQRGEHLSLAETLKEIEQRDDRDRQRTYSPLRPAPDSIRIDTSQLSPAQVVEQMLELLAHRHSIVAKPCAASQ